MLEMDESLPVIFSKFIECSTILHNRKKAFNHREKIHKHVSFKEGKSSHGIILIECGGFNVTISSLLLARMPHNMFYSRTCAETRSR